MPDPLIATGQMTLISGDLQPCPVCGAQGADFERNAMTGSIRFEADTMTLQPCQHSYDKATGMWRRR